VERNVAEGGVELGAELGREISEVYARFVHGSVVPCLIETALELGKVVCHCI